MPSIIPSLPTTPLLDLCSPADIIKFKCFNFGYLLDLRALSSLHEKYALDIKRPIFSNVSVQKVGRMGFYNSQPVVLSDFSRVDVRNKDLSALVVPCKNSKIDFFGYGPAGWEYFRSSDFGPKLGFLQVRFSHLYLPLPEPPRRNFSSWESHREYLSQ